VPPDSDQLLIQRIRQGQSGAWEELIARYEGRLLAYVQRRVRDRATCEDLVQETFLGFLRSLPHFQEERDLQTFLFAIAAHKLADFLRRQGRHPLSQLEREAAGLMQELPDRQPGASTQARSRERRQLESAAVARCLGQLLQQWQARGDYLRIKVLELLLVKGWSNRQVAGFLGLSEQQVANYRFAALKKLSERLRAAGLPAEVFPELASPE
jgi:RNA polymerase sigma-70 factor (ECF subfamily)